MRLTTEAIGDSLEKTSQAADSPWRIKCEDASVVLWRSKHAGSVVGTRRVLNILSKLRRRVFTRLWLKRCAFSARMNGTRTRL